MWRGKRPRIANTIMKEKSKVGGLTLPDFKITIKVQLPNSVILAKNRNIDKWNKTERPEINPINRVNRSLTKEQKEIKWRNDIYC